MSRAPPDDALLAAEEARRRALFVGRRAELEAFRQILEAPGPRILHVFGPAGIGKTALIQHFDVQARARGIETVRLDARDLDPSAPDLMAALNAAGVPPVHGAAGPRRVVFVDTIERLPTIDARELLLRVRGETIVVLAGRAPPGAEWRALSLWGNEVVPLPLRNLGDREGREYLERCGVDPAVAPAILGFAHGHPLALALAADAWRNASEPTFAPARAPDVITALYDFFMRGIAGPGQRAVLEIAAVLPVASESLLEVMLGGPAAGLLGWLRTLGFMLVGPRGVFPHDLAREVILAELRWRHPGRLASLAHRAQRHFAAEVTACGAGDPQFSRAFSDFAFVLAHNPRARILMVPPDDALVLDDLRDGDAPAICAAVARHEGDESEARARHWLARQPAAWKVARGPAGEVAGFALFLRLDRAAAADLDDDPLVAAAWEHALRLGVGPERPTAFTRFFMSCERHQEPSAAMALCSQAVGPLVFVPDFALLFVAMHAWEAWGETARLCGAEIVPELEHTRAGKRFLVTVQDHRGLTGVEWLARFSERTPVADWSLPQVTPPVDASLSALSRDEFRVRVREALRALHEPLALVHNPLVHCQAVRERVGGSAGRDERARALRALLVEQVEALRGSERGDAWHRVLHAAYVAPADKHEHVARQLDLSYSTFRRLLGAATEHIVARMWQFETA